MLTTRRGVLNTAMLGALLAYGLPVEVFASDASHPADAPLAQGDRALLNAIADTLIPRTATPGAADTGVVDFIDFVFRRGMQPAVRVAFQQGMQLLAADALRVAGARFEQATAQQRFDYLDALDRDLFAAQSDASRKPLLDFFATVKRLAVIGYFTSERGARSTLDVQLFPGTFQGSKPVDARTRTFYEDSFGVPVERPAGYLKIP